MCLDSNKPTLSEQGVRVLFSFEQSDVNSNSAKLTNQEKLDGLKYLSQIHRQQFDERRKYEWKTFFTCVTIFVLLGAAQLKMEIFVWNDPCIRLALVFAVLFIIVICICFLISVTRANRINKTFAKNAENLIEDMLMEKPKLIFDIFGRKVEQNEQRYEENNPAKKKKWSFFKSGIWALVYQIAILIVIGIATILILISQVPCCH